MVCLNALARHFQAQVIQARERAPGHDTPNPAHNTYTLKCEKPVCGPVRV